MYILKKILTEIECAHLLIKRKTTTSRPEETGLTRNVVIGI